MSIFKKIKGIVDKTDSAMDQAKKSIGESEKSVKTLIDILSVALAVSMVANVVTIVVTIASHKKAPKSNVVIHNLYLGVRRHE